jgi:hypothetical protein
MSSWLVKADGCDVCTVAEPWTYWPGNDQSGLTLSDVPSIAFQILRLCQFNIDLERAPPSF